MINQTYSISLVPGGIPVHVPVSQYDAGAGRNIKFKLIGPNSQAFEVPDGATVTCDGTKRDKKAFSYAVTASGSTVTVPVQEQMTAAAGPAVCQITISNDGAVLGTANFVLDVERAALADDADMSETEIASLQTWLAEAIAARDAAAASETAAADSATEAGERATDSYNTAVESANSAAAAATSAQAAAAAASAAAAEAAEATAAEIKESIQTELDAKAEQTDLDEVKATADAANAQATTNATNIATNTSNISSLQDSVSELNSNKSNNIIHSVYAVDGQMIAAGDTVYVQDADITKDGYTAIGVVGYNHATKGLTTDRAYASGTNLIYSVTNVTDSSIWAILRFDILYRKD